MKWIWTYYFQEINRNAEELITEEEREKKRIEKRKAKKKVPSECDRNLFTGRITLRQDNAAYMNTLLFNLPRSVKSCFTIYVCRILQRRREKKKLEKQKEKTKVTLRGLWFNVRNLFSVIWVYMYLYAIFLCQIWKYCIYWNLEGKKVAMASESHVTDTALLD